MVVDGRATDLSTMVTPRMPWDQAPEALERLQQVALSGENIFAELMETVKSCSLGQITGALYGVGGQYRRNM